MFTRRVPRKKKKHIKEKDTKNIFGGRFASEVSRGQFGGRVSRTSGTSRTDFCLISHKVDRMSAGQMEYFHGTSGARPRDGCDPNVEVSRHIPLCFSVFSLPKFQGAGKMGMYANGVGKM